MQQKTETFCGFPFSFLEKERVMPSKVRSRSRPYTASRGRKAHVRPTLYRRKLGGRPMVAPTLCDSKGFELFPALYNFSARSATCNCGKGKHAVFD